MCQTLFRVLARCYSLPRKLTLPEHPRHTEFRVHCVLLSSGGPREACTFVTPFQEAEAWSGVWASVSPSPDCEFHKARECRTGLWVPSAKHDDSGNGDNRVSSSFVPLPLVRRYVTNLPSLCHYILSNS